MKTLLFAAGVMGSAVAGYGFVGLAHAAERSIVIVQKGRAFQPANLTIAKGEALTFSNEDAFIHQVYVQGLFDSDERPPGDFLRETFTRTGTFEVRCHIHPKMRMVVTVR